MYHELPRHASFWAFLFSIDQDLAEQARQKKCPCGGCLHRANFPRKPRGGGEALPQEYDFRLSFCWRDEVANVREHGTTKEPPIERFPKERGLLRALPPFPFDTDEILSTEVSSHARVRYDGNRYSVPPALVGKTVTLRANATELRVLYQGQVVACHARCYEKDQVLVQDEHRLAALKARRRGQARQLEEEFDALGPEARQFHLKLMELPVKTAVHLRRLLALVRLYGCSDVLAASIARMTTALKTVTRRRDCQRDTRSQREAPPPPPKTPSGVSPYWDSAAD